MTFLPTFAQQCVSTIALVTQVAYPPQQNVKRAEMEGSTLTLERQGHLKRKCRMLLETEIDLDITSVMVQTERGIRAAAEFTTGRLTPQT